MKIEMPAPPDDVHTVWTKRRGLSRDDGSTVWEVIKWQLRTDVSHASVWRSSGSSQQMTWAQLLHGEGPVYTTHPDMEAIPPTPWTVKTDDEFGWPWLGDGRNGNIGRLVDLGSNHWTAWREDDGLGISEFICKAVNAYVESLDDEGEST